jgi:hypothetical protein
MEGDSLNAAEESSKPFNHSSPLILTPLRQLRTSTYSRTPLPPSVFTTGRVAHPGLDEFSLKERAQWKPETFKIWISHKASVSHTLPLSGTLSEKVYIHRESDTRTRDAQICYRVILFIRSVIRYDFEWTIASAIIDIHPPPLRQHIMAFVCTLFKRNYIGY